MAEPASSITSAAESASFDLGMGTPSTGHQKKGSAAGVNQRLPRLATHDGTRRSAVHAAKESRRWLPTAGFFVAAGFFPASRTRLLVQAVDPLQIARIDADRSVGVR